MPTTTRISASPETAPIQIARTIEAIVRRGDRIEPSLLEQLRETAETTAADVVNRFEELRSGT